MDPRAIAKAHQRLRLATKQLAAAEAAHSYDDFSDAWYLFLIAAKNVYTCLEQGAKVSPQSRQWFGAKKNERKNDPLLQYLFQARDDDEHGLGDVTKLNPASVAVGKRAPGYSSHIALSISTDSAGSATIHELQSLDGLPVLIEPTQAHAVLLPVTARANVTYPPPEKHLGVRLSDGLPLTVGKLGIAYLEALVAEADARVS